MFRTRDFVLFFTVIVFLVAAIGLTALRQQATLSQTNVIVPQTSSEIGMVTTEVVETIDSDINRAERLKSLKEKIKTSKLLTISEAPPDPVPEDEVVIELNTDTPHTSTPLLCIGYTTFYPSSWPVGQIKTESVEGLRQYFIPSLEGSASGTPVTARTVLLSLPQSQIPFGSPNCIPYDVIGIALDGSLIRNNETQLYRVFTDETLIGYALDGFPIYGVSQATSDQCGGRIVFGQYRYELNVSRDTIVNCFANKPQSFTP